MPALTPEEWALVRGVLEVRRDATETAAEINGSAVAAAQAARLTEAILSIEAGTPFGFTYQDVELLHFLARLPDLNVATGVNSVSIQLASLADRIAALLPSRSSVA